MTVASGKRPLRFCRTWLSAAIAIVAAGLSGCASTDPGAAPTPTSSGLDPSATALLVQPVTGTGPTGFPGVDFAIPSGARSVVVDSECERFSAIYSALLNADSGFTYYGAMDAAEWTSRIDQAAADLETLMTAAQSPLRDAFAQLHPIIGAPDRTVGGVLTEAAQKLIGEIGEVCGANQTPLFVVGEFGG